MAKNKASGYVSGKIEIPPALAHDINRVTGKTDNQKIYIKSIIENDLTLVTGCAGTGKTTVAIGMAVEFLYKQQIERIILTRPALEAGERIGFIPGSLEEKMDPFMRPLFDALNKFTTVDRQKKWISEGRIEIVPVAFMRGRTFDNAFIISDESQNLTLEQMKMVLSRLGVGSKLVITGDISQSDLPLSCQGALELYCENLMNEPYIGYIHLTESDIQRHPLVNRILKRMQGLELKDLSSKRPRELNEFMRASV